MATTTAISASTREKLLRAREAAAKLALLSTDEKNDLLLRIATAGAKTSASTAAKARQKWSAAYPLTGRLRSPP